MKTSTWHMALPLTTACLLLAHPGIGHSAEPMRLHYDAPAGNWMTQALPIGNGSLGAMVFGGVREDRLQFTEESLWNGRKQLGARPHNPELYEKAIDKQVAWDLFRNCIAAAKILDTDAGFVKRLEEALEKLRPPQIGKHGQIQEFFQDRDDPNDRHRHLSHLWGLYPGRQLTPQFNPEFAKAAQVSLQHRGPGGTSWSAMWKSLCWARLGNGGQAHARLREGMGWTNNTGMNYERGGWYDNLFSAHSPFQIDGNFGATAAMVEMLLQSHHRNAAGQVVVALLPALPPAWSEGAVRGLRAPGGFVIDMEWHEGRVSSATITAQRAGTLEVHANGNQWTPQLAAGQTWTMPNQ